MSTSTLRDILQSIYDERGELTPPLVETEARNPEHPLHSRLEWDNEKGGYEYRLIQAAQLIRSVRVVYKEDATGPKDLRAFTAIRGENTQRANYMPTEDALRDDFTRQMVLRDMEREWRSLKRRYEHMAEFAALILNDLKGEAS